MRHTGFVSSLLGNISFHPFKETHFCLFYQDFIFFSLHCFLCSLAYYYLIAHIVGKGPPPNPRERKPGSFPPVWNVPYRYPAFFTGRDQMVEQLFDRFTPEYLSGSSLHGH